MPKDQPANEPSAIGDHERPVSFMLAKAHGKAYHALRSLEEARRCEDGVVILEGDYGGQIYVVCPAAAVDCSENDLEELAKQLDIAAWGPEGSGTNAIGVYFERLPQGTTVPGGMGGGIVTSDVWIHQELAAKGLEPAILDTLKRRPSSTS